MAIFTFVCAECKSETLTIAESSAKKAGTKCEIEMGENRYAGWCPGCLTHFADIKSKKGIRALANGMAFLGAWARGEITAYGHKSRGNGMGRSKQMKGKKRGKYQPRNAS